MAGTAGRSPYPVCCYKGANLLRYFPISFDSIMHQSVNTTILSKLATSRSLVSRPPLSSRVFSLFSPHHPLFSPQVFIFSIFTKQTRFPPSPNPPCWHPRTVLTQGCKPPYALSVSHPHTHSPSQNVPLLLTPSLSPSPRSLSLLFLKTG